jgi:K+-sensing histidine kinase KdpD
MEFAMKATNTSLETLTKMTRISSRTDLSFHEKMQRILTEVVNSIEAEKGSIMITRDHEYLEVIASTDSKLIGVKQSISEKSPSSWTYLNQEPLYVENGEEQELSLRNQYAGYKKNAFLVVPIMSGESVCGVLNITDKGGDDQFSNTERDTIITMAGYVIGAIENYRLSKSLEENRDELDRKNKRLESLEALRTDLFNMLIHDLKGPISSIMANIDILSYIAEGESLEYVTAAQAGCDTLYRMTADLLDIARMEEGSLNPAFEMVTPHEILTDAISCVHSIARGKNVNLLEKIPDSPKRIHLRGDKRLLTRIAQNLIMNAIHHSPEGETVEIGYEADSSGTICFYVQDNGLGVKSEFQQSIFNKYFQIQKKADGRVYSTGLGLAFCKMAVEVHGGGIRVESDGKKGSRFSFDIPVNA